MSNNIIENEKVIQIIIDGEYIYGLGEYGNTYVLNHESMEPKWKLFIESPKYKQE